MEKTFDNKLYKVELLYELNGDVHVDIYINEKFHSMTMLADKQ